jgi:hypothetical protein
MAESRLMDKKFSGMPSFLEGAMASEWTGSLDSSAVESSQNILSRTVLPGSGSWAGRKWSDAHRKREGWGRKGRGFNNTSVAPSTCAVPLFRMRSEAGVGGRQVWMEGEDGIR